VKPESESDDAVDDWENSDFDEMADKMKEKEVQIPTGNDEEDKEEVSDKKDVKAKRTGGPV